MTLLREKSVLHRFREGRPALMKNLVRPTRGLVRKLTVKPNFPLLSWLHREFALTHEPGVALVNPDDEPGHCHPTQT